MKRFLPLLGLFLASCSNAPKCTLSDGLKPFPKCQTTPPKHEWSGFQGAKLPYLEALPQGKPRAVVIVIPGLDGVTGDYQSLTKELVRHGYAVYGTENRSGVYGPDKLQGTARDWHPWVEDVKMFSKFVKAKHPGVPVFWQGHSFGAVEVLAALGELKGAEMPKGVIIHSPGYFFMQDKGINGFKLFAHLAGGYHISKLKSGDNVQITSDPNWNCQSERSDDRLGKGYDGHYFIEAFKIGQAARQASQSFTIPVLALWGGKDTVAIGFTESLRPDYNSYMACELASGKADHAYFSEGAHLLTEGDAKDSTKKAAIAAILKWLGANSP